ncbi:Mss4-like protein [Xylariaceae sp. FL0662B]|nr:Mss4-like protein [Xylariaceae sp. FL0662B]
MPEGGCLCGQVRFSYEGEPLAKALCHCLDCRKISGSTYSTNVIVPGDGFKILSGTPKTYTKTADSGSEITSHFCGDCGSTLFRESSSSGANKIVKVGVMDDPDALAEAEPVAELFAPRRVSWVPEVAGSVQKTAM